MKIEDLFSLSNQIIIITGVKGNLGENYARFLLKNGAIVVGIDIVYENHLDSLKEDFPNTYHYYAVDLTQEKLLIQVAQRIINEVGIPKGLINNAALDSPPNDNGASTGPFEELSEKVWDKVIEVNLKSLVFTCKTFGSIMSKHGGGSIINISSIYGMLSPDQSLYQYKRDNNINFYKPIAYSASKAGVLNVTRYLATYWAEKNVRVNTLTPSGIFDNQDKQFLENYCGRIPIGRMANKEEFNGAIVFLLSQASSYMTGSNLVVDGGWTTI